MGFLDVVEVDGGLRGLWQLHGNWMHVLALLTILLAIHITAQAVYRLWFHPLSRFPGPWYMALSSLPHQYSNHIRGTWIRQVTQLHIKYGPIIRIGPDQLSLDGSIGWNAVYGHRPGSGERSIEFPKMPSIFPDGKLSLIGAEKTVHRRQRRQLAHGFSDSALTSQEPVLMRYVDLLLGCLDERVPDKDDGAGGVVEIVSWLNVVTLDIIGHLAFSEPFSCLAKDGHREPWMLSMTEGIRGVGFRRFSQAYPLLGWVFQKLGNSEAVRSLDMVRRASHDKAASRLARPSDKGENDFMAYMMRRTRDGSEGMDRDEVMANAPTLVIAGSETTASALSGFFFHLSRHPCVYAALAAEIRGAFAAEHEIDLRSAASLEYLQAVINEVLRVYPPAAQTQPRVSPGDVIAGAYVPEGTRCYVHQYATFRNPANFTDPDSFAPQRWLPPTHPLYESRFADDRRAVFKPFSHGPRDCIGKNLAFSEMRLIISRILFRFDFGLAHDQSDWFDKQVVLTLWSKGPLYIRLQRRQLES